MTPLEAKRQILLLIIQSLNDEKYKETVHQLERESGLFFNMEYFEELVINGDLDEAEKYLSGFTSIDDNRHSTKIFFEIRKQKFLEALNRHDEEKAKNILTNELKFVIEHDEKLFEDMTKLILKNDRIKKLGSVDADRTNLVGSLKAFIHENIVFRDKLLFPRTSIGRLSELLQQSMYWQHLRCTDYTNTPFSSLELETLFTDHTCDQSHDHSLSSTFPVINPVADGLMPRPVGQWVTVPPRPGGIDYRMSFISEIAIERPLLLSPAIVTMPPEEGLSSRDACTSTGNLSLDMKCVYDIASSSKIQQPITAIINSAVGGEAAADDLPKIVVAYLSEGSSVSSMAFHPLQHVLLLVGTNMGDVSIWDVGDKKMLVSRKSKASQTYDNDSINCVSWSLDGALIGVAYSKGILRIYLYRGGAELKDFLQIDAHSGDVRDLAFSKLTSNLVLSCGDDKTVKIWDCVTGTGLVLEGHEAAVHSLCLLYKKDTLWIRTESIVSTAVDGRIIVWMNSKPNNSYLAPGRSIMRMRSSADELRLFSCGTAKDGQSYLVEWEDHKSGCLKREYWGLGKSASVVQFDTTRNKYLAVGDESVIKFWHMDHSNLLETVDVGGLPESPCIRFNEEGTLLAVSTIDNAIKVLANADGMDLVLFKETLSLRL